MLPKSSQSLRIQPDRSFPQILYDSSIVNARALPFLIDTELGPRSETFRIAGIFVPSQERNPRTVLCTHGHGDSCCMTAWSRLFASDLPPDVQVIAFDAPCFGRSSGPSGQANLWRMSDGDLVLSILSLFDATPGRISACAQCMGAAMILRAIHQQPHVFENAPLLFHHTTLGHWPDSMTEALRAANVTILAYHDVDDDHLPQAVAYKKLQKLNSDPRFPVTFVDNACPPDNSPPHLSPTTMRIKYVSRCAVVCVFDPPPRVRDFFLDFLTTPTPTLKTDQPYVPLTSTSSVTSSTFTTLIRVRPSDSEYRIPDGFTFNFFDMDSVIPVVSDFYSRRGPKHSAIFAYGQTGSGKTYTINEVIEVVSTLERETPRTVTKEYREVVEGIEIRNLCPPSSASVREIYEIGSTRRMVRATAMNESSSRTHAILTLSHGERRLHIVDLGGSERVKRSKVSGVGLAEAARINTSLLHLVRCLNARANDLPHVPYRSSLLTRTLQGALEKGGRVVSIFCINPESPNESLSTLRVAAATTYIDPEEEASSTDLEDDEEAAVNEKVLNLCGSGGMWTPQNVYVRYSIKSESKTVVVPLHYYGGSCYDEGAEGWINIGMVSDSVGASIVAPDFPAHGKTKSRRPTMSAKPDPSSLRPAVEILQSVIAFAKSTGAHNIVVVGFDYGGGVAIEHAKGNRSKNVSYFLWNASYRSEQNDREKRQLKRVKVVVTKSQWHPEVKVRAILSATGAKKAVRCKDSEAVWKQVAKSIERK